MIAATIEEFDKINVGTVLMVIVEYGAYLYSYDYDDMVEEHCKPLDMDAVKPIIEFFRRGRLPESYMNIAILDEGNGIEIYGYKFSVPFKHNNDEVRLYWDGSVVTTEPPVVIPFDLASNGDCVDIMDDYSDVLSHIRRAMEDMKATVPKREFYANEAHYNSHVKKHNEMCNQLQSIATEVEETINSVKDRASKYWDGKRP